MRPVAMAQGLHSAHQFAPARVFYKFHPFFDHEVSVIRTLRSGGKSVIVQVGDSDLKIAVPAWMLDQAHCQPLALKDKACIDLDALLQLREIVDLHLGGPVAENMGSHPTALKGERHGQEPSADSSANT